MDSLSDISYEYFVEFETEKSCPHHFEGDPSILLFFQSWAFSVQFGGQHDLAKIASHLKQSLKINLSPLLKFADRNVENTFDARELQQYGQSPDELMQYTTQMIDALEHPDGNLSSLLTEEYELLLPRLQDLHKMCTWAVQEKCLIRMSFDTVNV